MSKADLVEKSLWGLIGIMALFIVGSCETTPEWSCEGPVNLTGYSPTGVPIYYTQNGNGKGTTQKEATDSALKDACSKFTQISEAERGRCERADRLEEYDMEYNFSCTRESGGNPLSVEF